MDLDKTSDIQNIRIQDDRRFFSATHEELIAGATTDIYFLRTRDILRSMGLLDSVVTADVFSRRGGLFCGSKEIYGLLRDKDIKVKSLPEGEFAAPGETVMQISGRYGEFGLFETVLLGMASSSTGWATAAKECKDAAGDAPVVCFGARHIHPAVAPVMERAALIGGADGCSCILGALLAGRIPSGTVPHAAILIAGDTVKVAEAFDEVVEADVARILLVDTFRDEAEEALRVANALKEKLSAVRLDTPPERGGVTPHLVHEIKSRLKIEGFGNVKVVVSGGVNPERIKMLKEAGADVFGVGSYISCAQPVEMTMDIKELNGKAIAKRGRIPGPAGNHRLVDLI
ncbi:MAG TPA: nicotinate phosphoribosyltransferase [bacterium]|nr:nicotinate phosphoribosyltransferase [bacterium]